MLGKRGQEGASTEEQNKKKREAEAAAYKQMEEHVSLYLKARNLNMRHWKNEKTDEKLDRDAPIVGANLSGAPDGFMKNLEEGKWTYGNDKFSVMVDGNGGMRPSRLPKDDSEFKEMWGRVLDAKVAGGGATSVTLNFDSAEHPWTKKRVEMFLALAEERKIGVNFGQNTEKFLEDMRKNDNASWVQNKISNGLKETGYEALIKRQQATSVYADVNSATKAKYFAEQLDKVGKINSELVAINASLAIETNPSKVEQLMAKMAQHEKQLEASAEAIRANLNVMNNAMEKLAKYNTPDSASLLTQLKDALDKNKLGDLQKALDDGNTNVRTAETELTSKFLDIKTELQKSIDGEADTEKKEKLEARFEKVNDLESKLKDTQKERNTKAVSSKPLSEELVLERVVEFKEAIDKRQNELLAAQPAKKP